MGGEVKENAKTFCLYHLFDLCRILQHAQKVERERQVSVNSFARGDSHVTFHRCYFHVFSLRTSTRLTFKANLGVVIMAYRYFERYKCSRLISRLHGLTDNGTDNVLGNRLSCDNRVDFSRRK